MITISVGGGSYQLAVLTPLDAAQCALRPAARGGQPRRDARIGLEEQYPRAASISAYRLSRHHSRRPAPLQLILLALESLGVSPRWSRSGAPRREKKHDLDQGHGRRDE